MKKIRITQIKSKIGIPQRQKRTLDALGLKRIRHTIEKDASPQVLGMCQKVQHLIKTE